MKELYKLFWVGLRVTSIPLFCVSAVLLLPAGEGLAGGKKEGNWVNDALETTNEPGPGYAGTHKITVAPFFRRASPRKD